MNCKQCHPYSCDCTVSNFTEEKINKNLTIPVQGLTGKSTYEEWLDLGNQGTEEDFMESQKGPKGDEIVPIFSKDVFEI